MEPCKIVPGKPYCYALADGGEVFYVGKGRGRRMYVHAMDAAKGKAGAKCDRIRAIIAAGRSLEYRVLGVYESDAKAYAAEKSWIARFDSLLNRNAGGGGAACADPKERIRRDAEHWLGKLLPKSVWLARLTPHLRGVIERVYGSVDQFYDFIRNDLMQCAIEPPPNVLRVGADGRHELGWE